MAGEMRAHEGAACALAACWPSMPARVPGRAHVPYALAMSFRTDDAGVCSAYALSRALDERHRKRIESLFKGAMFVWRD